MRKLYIFLPILVAVIFVGCSVDHGKDLVLRLTDKEGIVPAREVTVEYVNGRMEIVPEDILPTVGGEEGKREFLDNVINKELLVIEGMRQGLHEHERFPAYLDMIRDNWTNKQLMKQEVEQKVNVTDEMIDEYITKTSWVFDLIQITTSSEQDMEVALSRVEAGEDFGLVASEMSVAKTAEEGGQLPETMWRQLHPAVRDAIDGLEIGEMSEVVELPPFFLVFKVMDKKTGGMPIISIQEKIGKQQEAKAYYTKKRETEFFRDLLIKADPQLYEDTVTFLGAKTDEVKAIAEAETLDTEGMTPEEIKIAAVYIPQLSEEELKMPLAKFAKHNWTANDYVVKLTDHAKQFGAFNSPRSGDPAAIRAMTMEWIKDELVLDEIKARGLYEDPRLEARVTHAMEEAIVNIMYNEKMLQTDPVISGSEIRTQYRENKEKYFSPLEVEARQIIVDTEAKANELKQMLIEGGADFGELALKYSSDEYTKEKEGVIGTMVEGSGRTFAYLRPHVFEIEVGEIGGPVPGPVGTSVLYRVDSRKEPRQLNFDEAESMVRDDLTEVKQEERLENWLTELEEKTEIEIFEDKIQYLDDPTTVEHVGLDL